MSLIVDEHRELVGDHARISGFRAALNALVRPEHVVLDLGSGTGVLGLLACQAGAKRVYSIEAGGMIGLAREIARANGFHDRIVFLKGLSTQVDLPEPVDLVVCDQIGRFGFEAGLLKYYRDAARRLLKPDAIKIPSRINLYVALVEHGEMWGQVEFWNSSPAGLDFRPARALAANTGYPVKYTPEHLLSEPSLLTTLDPAADRGFSFRSDLSLVAKRAGELHGIGGWFSAQLSPDVLMTNSPLAPDTIKRRNVFFPVDRPVSLVAGDRVRLRMQIIPGELVVAWKVQVWSPAAQNGRQETLKAEFSHSTLQGMLITCEDLQRTRPHFVPKMSSWGEARLSILRLCDGKRSLSEIEQEVARRHPGLFPSPGEAAEFVAEVITRYSI